MNPTHYRVIGTYVILRDDFTYAEIKADLIQLATSESAAIIASEKTLRAQLENATVRYLYGTIARPISTAEVLRRMGAKELL